MVCGCVLWPDLAVVSSISFINSAPNISMDLQQQQQHHHGRLVVIVQQVRNSWRTLYCSYFAMLNLGP